MPKHLSCCPVALLACALVVLALHGAEPASPRGLAYPKDLRDFRARSLKADGVFAPDIAFALRTCPHCHKPYVMGTFPRMKRMPLDSLAAVHQVVAKVCLKKAPSGTMYSPRLGRQVPRACPVCDTPEEGGLPDKVLFCHVIPESGDDMQIEYEANDGQLAAHKFWRVPKDGAAAPVALPDEGEDAIERAYGWHFSLRAVWNELLARSSREDLFAMEPAKPVYRKVAPGLWFILRPRAVSAEAFKEFSEKQLEPDRQKGLFTDIWPPLLNGEGMDTSLGTIRNWAAQYEPALSNGSVECLAACSVPELQKAAGAVLASRRIALRVEPSAKDPSGGIGILSKGDFRIEADLSHLAQQAVLAGLSFHHACAFYLTMPVFTIESADRLNRVLREVYAACSFEVRDGRFLILRDEARQERKLDLRSLADKLDPDNQYMFGLFCDTILAWDRNNRRFGPQPKDRDVSPTGLPAFIERRIRPPGYLKARDLPEALYEPREDCEGRAYDLCYTSECSAAVVYVDPAKDRFKGLTLEDVRTLYEATGATLPMYIEAQDTLSSPGDPVARTLPCKIVLLCGLDLASLAADGGRAIALAEEADLRLHSQDRLHFYAFSTNTLALAQRKLTADELKLARARLKDLAAGAGQEAGLELGLHFDLPHTEPRGRVWQRHK
ncbi:MAG: hypothetical protein ABSE73_26370 [Planctomycetota bacterium]